MIKLVALWLTVHKISKSGLTMEQEALVVVLLDKEVEGN